MAKEKQPLTQTQQLKKCKRISRGFFAGELGSVATPFITIGIINHEKYFVEQDGVKMSIGAALAAAVMGFAIWLVSKKKISHSYAVLMVGWAALTAIFFLIGKAINDIAYIMLFGFIGICGAFGLDLASAKYERKAEEIQRGIQAGKEERIKNAYLKETEESEKKKTIRIKVRKDE